MVLSRIQEGPIAAVMAPCELPVDGVAFNLVSGANQTVGINAGCGLGCENERRVAASDDIGVHPARSVVSQDLSCSCTGLRLASEIHHVIHPNGLWSSAEVYCTEGDCATCPLTILVNEQTVESERIVSPGVVVKTDGQHSVVEVAHAKRLKAIRGGDDASSHVQCDPVIATNVPFKVPGGGVPMWSVNGREEFVAGD